MSTRLATVLHLDIFLSYALTGSHWPGVFNSNFGHIQKKRKKKRTNETYERKE